jgi:hypothetical protein
LTELAKCARPAFQTFEGFIDDVDRCHLKALRIHIDDAESFERVKPVPEDQPHVRCDTALAVFVPSDEIRGWRNP